MARKRPRLSQRRKAAGSALPREAESEVWLDQAAFENLTRPQGGGALVPRPAGPVMVPPPAGALELAQPVGAGSDELDTTRHDGTPLPVIPVAPRPTAELGRPVRALRAALFDPLGHTGDQATTDIAGFAGFEIFELAPTEVASRPSRLRFRQFAPLCVVAVAVAGWVTWALLMSSSVAPVPQAVTGVPVPTAPVADIPSPGAAGRAAVDSASDGARSEDPAGAVRAVPADPPSKPAAVSPPPPPASMPDAHDTRTSSNRTIVRHKPSVPVAPPPSANPDEEDFPWSTEFNAYRERWTPFRYGYPPHRP